MIININEKKGITLISMVLTVIVLLIIVGTISYSSRSSFETKKLEDLYSDIDTLYDAVSIYYIKNKTLPVYYSNKTITGEKVEYQPIAFSETDDKYTYYIIDVTKLNNIVLNNKNNVPTKKQTDVITGEEKIISLFDSGTYSETITTMTSDDGTEIKTSDFDKALNEGMFVVNSSTHAVYYTKGVIVDDVTYYTKNEEFSKIPTFSKIDKRSIEDDILNKDENVKGYDDENVTIIFYANGGTDAPDNMTVSRKNVNTAADSLEEKLNGGIDGIVASIPNKNGMKFIGWSTLKEAGTPLYEYDNTKTRVYKCNGSDIRFSQTASNVIELYAVWEVDENLILYCYYPESTGGILPTTLDNKKFERMGKGDSVKNYFAIDIPSSGYYISWDWEANASDLQEARYVGKSQTNPISSGISSYQTTEPGTIQIKGSFSNLNIILNTNEKTLEDGIITTQSDLVTLQLKENENIKILDIYQINSYQKDMVGGKVNAKYKWLTGIDGKIEIPSNPKTFIPFGINSPAGDAKYDVDEKTQYYLKSIVLFDEEKLNNSIVNGGQTHKLGDIVKITDENNCLYPCFGARNYVITSSTGGIKYYHENLQEAYNQALELNYDKITLLRNVNSCTFQFAKWHNLNDRKNIDWLTIRNQNENYEKLDSKYYVPEHDPSYAIDCVFETNKSTYKVTLDCSDYIIGRKANINLKQYANLVMKANSSNSGIIFFNNTSSESIKLYYASNLYIQDGITVLSDNGTVIGLQNSASLYLHKGKIINSNIQNPKAIYSNASQTRIYIGIKENANELYANTSFLDGDVIISTEKGVPVSTAGRLYWKSGLLKTADISCKSGYNDVDEKGSQKNIYTKSTDLNACLYYDFSENKICAKLGVRNWKFYDEDSGKSRAYYSDNLQDAHDCINLLEKEFLLHIGNNNSITWNNPLANSGEENSATITKKGILIDFNSFNLDDKTYNTSSLYVKTGTGYQYNLEDMVIICNLNCETTKGIKIENSAVAFEKINVGLAESAESSTHALNFKNSYVDMSFDDECKIYTKGDGYAIYNQDSKCNISNENDEDNEKLEIFTDSNSSAIYNTGSNAKLEIDFDNLKIYSTKNSTALYIITNENNAVFECLGSNSSIEVKNIISAANGAINNNGICNLKTNIKSDVTYTDGYAIRNRKKLNLYSNIQAAYGIYNNNVATAEIYLKDSASITTTKRGINSKKGSVYILPNEQENKYPSITTTATDSIAILLSGGANLYLGDNSDSVVSNGNYPLITSAKTGIQSSTSDKIYFYDGKIKAKGDCLTANAKKVCVPTSGYSVIYITESPYNVARLGFSAPQITAKKETVNGETYESGTWYNKNIYVFLDSSSLGSNLKEYRWKAGTNGTWSTSSVTITNNVGRINFQIERNSVVYFKAIDKNGVESEVSSITIRIDKTPPIVSCSPNGQTITGNKFSTVVTANDSASLVKIIQYYWSTSATTQPSAGWGTVNSGGTVSKNVTSSSKYYLWLKVTDNAGNITVYVSNEFKK